MNWRRSEDDILTDWAQGTTTQDQTWQGVMPATTNNAAADVSKTVAPPSVSFRTWKRILSWVKLWFMTMVTNRRPWRSWWQTLQPPR